MKDKDPKESPRDKGRRRLIKMALYAPPTIIGLSSFMGRAYAQSPKASSGAESDSDVGVFVGGK